MTDQEKMNQEEQQKKGLEGGPLALALAGAALVGGSIVAVGGWAKGKLKARKAKKAAEAEKEPEKEPEDKKEKKK